jgi:type IV secretion system protein VirB1
MSGFIGAILPALLLQCGPAVSPNTLAAIMHVESSRHSWAINDNTTGKAYFPGSEPQALSLADGLLAQGHKLAIGSMQIHSQWLGKLGLTPAALLDPCINVHVASLILRDNDRVCALKGYQGKERLDCALTAYSSGRFQPDSAYARKVQLQLASAPKTIGPTIEPSAPTPAPRQTGVFADDRIFTPTTDSQHTAETY